MSLFVLPITFAASWIVWIVWIVSSLATVSGTIGSSCLPESIPEQDRLWVDVVGRKPIRLLVYNWPSAEAFTSIANMLINEVLGVHSVMNETINTVLEAALKLSGCEDTACVEIFEGAHSALETWDSASNELKDFREAHAEKAPVDLGSVGYTSEDGLYLSKATLSRSYDETGNSLDFYRGYNQSHHRVHQFFDSLAELQQLPFAEFVDCNESKWVNPAFINPYVQYTGDLDGVIEVGAGDYHARCPNGKFWIAPACRQNFSECIPIVTGGYGWSLDIFMMWSTSYGLPTALGVTRSFASYTSSISATNVLFYWWRPDVTFLHLDPQQVIFPRHDADAWEKGDKRTASQGGHIGKLVNVKLEGMGGIGSRVHAFLDNVEISLQDIEAVLAIVATGKSIADAACDWITSNEAKWQKWIPVKTACGPGYGLINRSLQYVSSRTTAVDCGLCIPGRFSELVVDSVGRTHRCTACEAGHYQHLSGETFCAACEVGRFQAEGGQSDCALCPLGSFANSSGMTSCERCGNGTHWTTNRLVQVAGGGETEEKWIETEGASSVDLCSCVAGWYLYHPDLSDPPESGQSGHHGHHHHSTDCRECSSGTRCVGGELQLLQGYFSSREEPGNVFRCFNSNGRCPGGLPGTCASGRDTSSVDCGRCLPGLRAKGAECVPCDGVDYFILALLGFFFCLSSGMLHLASLLASQSKKQTSLMNAIVAVNQLATCLQFLSVMGQLHIDWGDPFKTLLRSFDFLSPKFLWENLDAINCFTRLSPVSTFLLQNLGVPGLLCAAPVLIHVISGLRKEWKLHSVHLLLGTLGLLCVLFVTISCNSILEPFQCERHPNGLLTMRSNHDVFCTFSGVHLDLCIFGWILCLFPILFLSLCSWILLCELPKRLQVADMKFLQACSFLILRFRPGSEIFALFLLLRNMLFAFSPVLRGDAPALLMMQILICFSFGLVAYFKPWPTRLATCVDLFIHMALLLILIFGAFFLELQNAHATMVVCAVVIFLMMLSILAMAADGIGRYLLSPIIKPYRFFLCHHKGGAGSLARWLKMELSRRSASKVFIDSDNLTDLTRLFTIVSEQVQTVIIIASPGVLTRKWCVGEMVAARLRNVDALLLTLPAFVLPDHQFLKAFEGMIPEVKELASYGFGVPEILDTFRWLSTIPEISLERITLAAFNDVVAELLNSKTPHENRNSRAETSNCLILADLDDTEAVATAHILSIFIGSDMMRVHGAFPQVLNALDSISKSLDFPVLFLTMICTKDCLVSFQMATWLLEALDLSEADDEGDGGDGGLGATSPLSNYIDSYLRGPSWQSAQSSQIFILPLVAEDFQVPSRSSFEKILKSSALASIDKIRYVNILQAIFFQIALPFAPKVSSESDLRLKAKQITERLRSDAMGSLQSNFTLARASAWGLERSRSNLHLGGSHSLTYELCSETTEETVERKF